jgi:hypothetical protein
MRSTASPKPEVNTICVAGAVYYPQNRFHVVVLITDVKDALLEVVINNFKLQCPDAYYHARIKDRVQVHAASFQVTGVMQLNCVGISRL